MQREVDRPRSSGGPTVVACPVHGSTGKEHPSSGRRGEAQARLDEETHEAGYGDVDGPEMGRVRSGSTRLGRVAPRTWAPATHDRIERELRLSHPPDVRESAAREPQASRPIEEWAKHAPAGAVERSHGLQDAVGDARRGGRRRPHPAEPGEGRAARHGRRGAVRAVDGRAGARAIAGSADTSGPRLSWPPGPGCVRASCSGSRSTGSTSCAGSSASTGSSGHRRGVGRSSRPEVGEQLPDGGAGHAHGRDALGTRRRRSGTGEMGCVFHTNGRPVGRSMASKYVRRRCAAAGLEGHTWHDLRHHHA